MSARKRVKVFEKYIEAGDVAYNCKLPQFLAQIDALIGNAAKEAGVEVDRGEVGVDMESGDDFERGKLVFEYWRDETDAEMAVRLAWDADVRAKRAAKQEMEERAKLAELKARYEGKT